ncbi:hypothetical protein, conserved [Eimeria tenella]|uniref:Uncharacterized protein n=1 Tax=Eimeria tenella TaxID=5802 RepID=U6L3D0_EIMTE|nr:hypothetical protein, conserved [Eimeria tenella]CDJ44671.1 hypothetical protein, conserved [Eimeria tenella]|eukprot:XP_013235419.1 hypothetical protein, conserved [Eimeria tenella]
MGTYGKDKRRALRLAQQQQQRSSSSSSSAAAADLELGELQDEGADSDLELLSLKGPPSPNRGAPNRGAPNRGAPTRGAPMGRGPLYVKVASSVHTPREADAECPRLVAAEDDTDPESPAAAAEAAAAAVAAEAAAAQGEPAAGFSSNSKHEPTPV